MKAIMKREGIRIQFQKPVARKKGDRISFTNSNMQRTTMPSDQHYNLTLIFMF